MPQDRNIGQAAWFLTCVIIQDRVHAGFPPVSHCSFVGLKLVKVQIVSVREGKNSHLTGSVRFNLHLFRQAVSLAHGFPRRVMITSSPSSKLPRILLALALHWVMV